MSKISGQFQISGKFQDTSEISGISAGVKVGVFACAG